MSERRQDLRSDTGGCVPHLQSIVSRWGFLLALLIGAMTAGAAEASPRQLVEIADFSSPMMSPDGDRVAFRIEQASVERNAYDTVWYVQTMDGASPPRRVSEGGLPLRDSAGISVSPDVAWSPDGRWIYYRALIGGRIDVWRAATDGSGAEPVTRDAADVRDFSLSATGEVLSYSVGATREEIVAAEWAEYYNGVRLDRATPLGQPLFRSGYTQGRLATERLGVMFNRVALTAGISDRWKAVDLATGETRDLVESDILVTLAISRDLTGEIPDLWKRADDLGSARVAFLTRTGERTAKPRVTLAMLASDGVPLVRCLAEACVNQEIVSIQWRPDSDEVLFTVAPYDEGFAQTLFRWNVETGTVLPVATSSGMFAGESRWGPGMCGASSTALACVTTEANRPPRLERIDLESGDRQVLFDPNAALARDLAGIPARMLRWTDVEGRRFTGQFYPARRTGQAAAPLFITYYRCLGFVRGGSGDEWPLASLAEAGISTLCINAPSFSANAAERYDTGRSGVASVVDLLALEGEIDRTKVGMGGLSFGAEVTMWTLIHSDLIAAASMASPSTSQQYYLLGSNIGEFFEATLQENWQLGNPREDVAGWRNLSPVDNIENIDAPILMQIVEQEYMHGLDYLISLSREQRADIYIFPHEPHNKFQPRHKLAVYERNLDWFRFWLQDYVDSDPRKAEQYRHWEAMRDRARGIND